MSEQLDERIRSSGQRGVEQTKLDSAGAGLVDSTGEQERRFGVVFRLLEEAIARKVFPGAALAVTQGGELLAWKGLGRFTYEADSAEVRRETVWDLASLTKVIATTSMAMVLWQRGRLELDAPVVGRLPEFASVAGAERGDERKLREMVTARMLLAHCSGLPAHRKLYLETQASSFPHSPKEGGCGPLSTAVGAHRAAGREAMVAAAMRVPLTAEPMTRAKYSDIGFMVLGELLERIAGERIDEFCRREIFSPLKIEFRFSPELTGSESVPPTVIDTEFRGRVVQGEVNDENASAMGGVAAHAGLFGDALSVARFAEFLLQGGEPVFRRETVELFTKRYGQMAGSSRALGWDTPSRPSQSGTRFSGRSFGHLGYTGTSLWCDAERVISVTLLTNRSWPDGRIQAIKEVRPVVHDAIMSALDV